jgi:hypothetical protein
MPLVFQLCLVMINKNYKFKIDNFDRFETSYQLLLIIN